jgi:tetratricopeptide (TPR) repeat protein
MSDVQEPLPRDRALEHLEYIRRLWERVEALERAGLPLGEIQEQLSLDTEFSFVKDMGVYRDEGDDWLRPQHHDHVRLFYLQHKDLIASKIIMEGGAEGLKVSLARVRKLLGEGVDIYYEESSINGVGYYFMGQGNLAGAIEVFKLNVELYPESANVYDSLGEAYMKNGDKEEAIVNYQRSLELNPENTNAVTMLEELEKM